jgi:hypothetical protein
VAAQERDSEHGYPATPKDETITKNVQKFIDKKTGYMKTEYEVALEEKAEKAKEV